MKRGVIVSSLVLLLVIVGVVLWLYGSRARNRCDDYAYIPDGIFTKQMDSPATLWEYYSAMQEVPFSCLDSSTEAYRFLFIPSFDSPASIRIWRDGNHNFVAIKQLRKLAFRNMVERI